MWRRWCLPVVFMLIGCIGYAAFSYAAFVPPKAVSSSDNATSGSDNNDCGFNPADFTSTGELRFSKGEGWWISFLRQHEYFSALSMGLILAFVAFAIGKVRQIGLASVSGAVAGGGLLAVLTLCLGCLAPTLAAVGLGLLGNLALPIPKWLMLLNTLILTTCGTIFLSRRARLCPINPKDTGSGGMVSREMDAAVRMER